MEERVKDLFRTLVSSCTLKQVQDGFSRHKLVIDDSFFDYSLLKAALGRKHMSLVNYLLKMGCRVKNTKTDNSETETAIYLALKMGNPVIIRKMLKNGASIDDKNSNGETALYAAFIERSLNGVSAALSFASNYTLEPLEDFLDPDKGIDPKNVDDIRHFQIACVTDHYTAVKAYLNYGFDVNSRLILNSNKYFGLTALHYAASEKLSRRMMGLLLEHGGDVSLKSSNGKTPLQTIYYSRFSECNKSLIEEIFSKGNHTKYINSVDNNGVSHFHMSCAINHSEYAQVFIERGVDLNRPISSQCSFYPGYTPLHIAVLQGCDVVVQLLLKNGADANQKSTDSTTPLHLACKLLNEKQKFSIIQMLISHNASPAAEDKDNCTPLHLAFWHINLCEQSEIYDMLISRIPRHVNCTNNTGLSHFHLVCIRNNLSRVKDFLKTGIDVNNFITSEKYNGFTALHFAVLYNHKDVVEELLKWKAKVNIPAKYYLIRPLHLACNFNHKKFHEVNLKDNKSVKSDWIVNRKSQIDIIKLLLSRGADVNAQDSSGRTPLLHTFTIDSGYYYLNASEINKRIRKINEILLSNKANINATTNHQDSIFHIMSESNCLNETEELIDYLLSQGANLHAVNKAGYTPLHVAVNSQKEHLVKIFLKHHANINAKSKEGLIPLQMVVKHMMYRSMSYIRQSSNNIICILLENGSYVDVKCTSTKSLLHIAIESQNIFVTEKLLDYWADINIEDGFGHSTLCLLTRTEIWESRTTFAILFQKLFTHIQKLLALGLYVSAKVQRRCKELLQLYRSISSEEVFKMQSIGIIKNLDNIFDKCLEELDKMKLIKIDNYTSLYNILLKDTHEVSKHVRNSTFVEILENPNINNNFPLYSKLLTVKYKKGLRRSDLLEFAKAVLHNAFKLNLPDLCYDSILKHLSDGDIINLKALVKYNTSPINTHINKRKRSNDNLSDADKSKKKLAKQE